MSIFIICILKVFDFPIINKFDVKQCQFLLLTCWGNMIIDERGDYGMKMNHNIKFKFTSTYLHPQN